tara:strand:+ start:201 stop:638 length:438 start_codon:yes stop_codon:yes gene_type:complete
MDKVKQNISLAILISVIVGASLGFLVSDYVSSITNEETNEDNTTDRLIKELITSNKELKDAVIESNNNIALSVDTLSSELAELNSSSDSVFNNQLIAVLEKIARHTCLDAKYDAVSGAYFNDSSYSWSRGGQLMQDTRIINSSIC